MFDVAYARGHYTSLSDGWTYLNAQWRAQIPERVSSSVATSFRASALFDVAAPVSGAHSDSGPGTRNGDRYMTAARQAVADLVGADPKCVVLGPSKEVLLHSLAFGLQARLRRSTQVVVNRVDDEACIRPFLDYQADVAWAEPDLGTGELPAWQYDRLVDGSTRLVVLPAAHPYIGTVTDVTAISDIVRAKSRAWLLVDASAVAPYRKVSLDDWGADIIVLEFAPMGGPQLAALIFRDTSMFPLIKAVNPLAETDCASKLELGAISSGLAAGVTMLVDHYASLALDGDTRSEKLDYTMDEIDRYTRQLVRYLVNSLQGLPSVHILGVSGEAAGRDSMLLDRVPRVTFTVRGVPAEMVQHRLLTNGLVTNPSPPNPLLDAMGAFENGGAITIGMANYNTFNDIDQLTRVLASLA